MTYPPSAATEPLATRAFRPEIVRAARKYGPWILACLLNSLLFVPSYAFSTRSTFFPNPARAKSHNFLLFIVSRGNLDVFRVSFDFVLLALIVIATAGTRWRNPVRRFAAAYYSLLLVFL